MIARLLRRRRDLPLLAEAVLWLGLAWLALRLLPFRRLAVRLRPPVAARRAGEPERVAWAVRAAAARVPWSAMCFHQGIAAQRMLCRRGIAADLVYGVAKGLDGQLDAHVWVSADGRMVVGGEGASRFTEVTRFRSDEGKGITHPGLMSRRRRDNRSPPPRSCG